MQMSKIMWISRDADTDIRSTSTRGVDFLIFANADIDVDAYFEYLRMRIQMRMLKIMRISSMRRSDPPLLEV